MTSKERFVSTLSYKNPVLFHHEIGLFWAWEETKERWRREGWNGQPFENIFKIDQLPRVPVNYGPSPEFEEIIIEESEEYRTYQDAEGVIIREPIKYSGSRMPEFLKYPVDNLESYHHFKKERLDTPFNSRTMEGEAVKEKSLSKIEKKKMWKTWVEKGKNRKYPVFCFTARWGGFFGPLRSLMGIEKACLAFYDNPKLVEEFMSQRAESIIRITGSILDVTSFEMFGFWEDMAYKNGPLISPQLFRKYAYKCYRKVCDYLYGRGVKYIFVDSDGDVQKLIPLWLDAGINGIFPCEATGGMDIVKLRNEYGKRLLMFGGVNKRVLERNKKDILSEIDRVTPIIEEGGYLPCLDHGAHPDIPWENMCFYVEELQKRFRWD